MHLYVVYVLYFILEQLKKRSATDACLTKDRIRLEITSRILAEDSSNAIITCN